MKSIHFFALKDDLLAVLAAVESAKPLKFAKTGHFPTPAIQWLSSGSSIPNIGIAEADSAVRCESYLIAEHPEKVKARSIKQLDGRVVYSVDQLVNPDTVTMSAGGQWTENVIIDGRIGSASDSAKSQEIMKLFNSEIRKRFKKVNAFWVGPLAYERLLSGSRLTAAVDSPSEYDLAI
jgi:hypothetical protein